MSGEQALLRALFDLLSEEQATAQETMIRQARRNATPAAIDELVERVFLSAGPRAMALLADPNWWSRLAAPGSSSSVAGDDGGRGR